MLSTTGRGVPVIALPPRPAKKVPTGCTLAKGARKLPGGVTTAATVPSRNMTPLNETSLGSMNGFPWKPTPHVPAGIGPAGEKFGAVPGTSVILTPLGSTIVIACEDITLPAVAPVATRSSSVTASAVAGAVYVAVPTLVTAVNVPPPAARCHSKPPKSAAGLGGKEKKSRL